MTRLSWRGVAVVSRLVSLAACGGAPPVVAPVEVTIAEPAREKTLSEEPAGPDAGPVPITAADPSSGADDAPVTLVQIGDFGNPFCAQMAPWIQAIRARYPLDRLRIVNGVWVLSLSSADALQTAIDAELRRADQLLAAGMPRGKVHAARTTENLAIKAGRSAKGRDPARTVGGGEFGAKHLLVMYQGSTRSAPGVTRTKGPGARARARERR